MELVTKVTEIRIIADGLINQSFDYAQSVESQKAHQSLQMGKSWLGKFKGELGLTTPYKVVDNPLDIPQTDDTASISNLLPIAQRLPYLWCIFSR